MPTSGGAPCQRGGAVLSVNDGVVLNTNEGGGSMPTRLTRGEGEERSLPMRECAQCQKWGVLNINDGRCSMPTMWGTQCQRGKLLNLNEGERSKPITGGAACQQGVVFNTNEEGGRGKEKRMMKIVATYFVASRPIRSPSARVNFGVYHVIYQCLLQVFPH